MRQKALSPLLRSLAALALVVFVVAQALCFVHCNFGGGNPNKAQPSCHASPRQPASHDADPASAPSTPAPTAACLTLNTMLASGDAPALLEFQTHTLYLPPSIVLVLEATENQPQAAYSRQARSRERIFTPEVCLGPAFRSLAPPFLG